MGKTIRRLVGALCIISALILTQIPARLSQAASVAKEDFLLDNQTLVKYTGTATTVSVSDDIKVIGEEAFANNQYLGVINIGKNVKEINHGAFANCNYLNRVVIPDSVNEIEAAAFSGCTGLKNVSIGDSVETIGDGAFAGCSSLAGIGISRNNNNFRFEAGVLYDNTKDNIYSYLSANPYDNYYMPNSVKNISPFSFWGNNQLNEVYLSSSLESIPAYAFSNCRNLKVVQIPYSVDSIDAKAFENCISLGNVIIPASVKYIDPTAFDGCVNLNIIADEGSTAYNYFLEYDRSDIGNAELQDVKDIAVNVHHYSDETNIENDNDNNITTHGGYIDASQDPSNVEWMPSVNPLIKSENSSVLGKTIVVNGRAVLFVDREMQVNQLTNEEIKQQIDSYNEIENRNDNSEIIYDSEKGGFIPKYTYIDDCIASQAFYASDNDNDFMIPSGVKHIGDFSFARSTIESVIIPDGVQSIGYGAFYHCDKLNEVIIPSSVSFIDGYAFDNTPYLENFKKGNNGEFLIVGDGILLAYAGVDSDVVIPEGVKSIASCCFMDNKTIKSVNLPESLINIEPDAFRNCSNLTNVFGGENVKHIKDRAFMSCPVSGFVVGDKVESLGLRAFDFSNTDLDNSKKTIVFSGDKLPVVEYDSSSSRLSNYDYRQDALYNVFFAVVDNKNIIFDDTVLDSDALGFSGVIVSLEDNGTADIVNSYIYSEELLNNLANKVCVASNEYIFDKEMIQLTTNPYEISTRSKNIKVEDDIDDYDVSAHFSEEESCSKLVVDKSDIARSVLNAKYATLFGGDNISNLEAYDIKLIDDKGIVEIDKLGRSSLYITLPFPDSNQNVHVITLDEDGQLEELTSTVDETAKTVTFETSHLSYFGVYSNSDDLVLKYKDGKLVKNYKLDESPNTGDSSIPIIYIICVALASIGLILILMKGKI